MAINWKKRSDNSGCSVLAVYLVVAFTAFNKPDETVKVCTKVSINIQDESTNGFINAKEIKTRLDKACSTWLGKQMHFVNVRNIEDMLKRVLS